MLEVDLVRLDPGLPVPARAHPGDAAVDLTARADVDLAPGARALVDTGIALALPEGYAGFVHPRSGWAAREGLGVLNAPGTVDAGYRGEIRVCLVNHDPARTITVRRGDRIAQLLVQRVEQPVFRVRAALDDSSRGDSGFGSTGTGDPAGSTAAGDRGGTRPDDHGPPDENDGVSRR